MMIFQLTRISEAHFQSIYFQAEKIKNLEERLKKFESHLEDKTKSLETKIDTHINQFIASKLPSNTAMNISGLNLASVTEIPMIKSKLKDLKDKFINKSSGNSTTHIVINDSKKFQDRFIPYFKRTP